MKFTNDPKRLKVLTSMYPFFMTAIVVAIAIAFLADIRLAESVSWASYFAVAGVFFTILYVIAKRKSTQPAADRDRNS